MSGKLPQEQGTALIRQLAKDDAFRAEFEKDPRSAMASLGIPDDVLDSLDSTCLRERTLAPKEAFSALLDEINGEALQAAMRMQTPEARLR
jgi:putative modified peptide